MEHADPVHVGRGAYAEDSRRPAAALGGHAPATDALRALAVGRGLTPGLSSAPDIRALQRAAGNRATRQLLRLKKDAEFDDAVALVKESFTALQQFVTGMLTGMLGGLGSAIASFVFRPHLVFIMGKDSGGFYDIAEHYWRLHDPLATFVTDQRTLADVINWINANATQPLGRVTIVSHANENGTLSFGVDASDTDRRTSFAELKKALHGSGGGSRTLPTVGNQVSKSTSIEIKGCDIGRSTDMLNLLSEAFNGASVHAPTHEQGYGWSDREAQAARDKARAFFRTAAEAKVPAVPPVDPKLTGAAKKAAGEARKKAVKARDAAIAADVATHKREIGFMTQWGKFYEFFSGPEVETPGTTKIDLATVRARVDHLYPHLTDKERAQLARELVAAEAVETIRPYSSSGDFATTLAQARVVYKDDLKANNLTATGLKSVTRSGTDKTHVEVVLDVIDSGQKTIRTYTMDLEDDATIIANAKAEVSNPEHYEWDVVETRVGATTTRTGRGRRMRAYLHHHSLDDKATPHFDVTDESNPDFFGASK
ncbi:MAG: hypothetical protein ACXVSE_03865 [Solirubrobacteraceae bacterium]